MENPIYKPLFLPATEKRENYVELTDNDKLYNDLYNPSGSRSESGKAMSNSTLTQGEKADKAANIISSAGSLLTGASNLIGSITGKGTPSEVNNYYEDDSSKTWIIVGILLVVVLVVVLVIANRK